MEALEQGQNLVPNQATLRVGIARIDPEGKSSCAAVGLRLVAPEREQRAHDAVLALRLDASDGAARNEPIEHRLRLVGSSVPGCAEPVVRDGVAQVPQFLLGYAAPLRVNHLGVHQLAAEA